MRRARGALLLASLVLTVVKGAAWDEPSEVIFLRADRLVFVSEDGGQSWRAVVLGVVHDLQDEGGGRAGILERSSTRSGLLVATHAGVFRIARSGREREQLLDEETFAVAESQGRIFASTRQGVLLSRDGGKRWEPIRSLPEGLVAVAIEVAPSDPRVIYLGTVRHGIYRSEDGGMTWRRASTGLPEADRETPWMPVWSLAVHPRDPHTVYLGIEAHRIYKTTDGGETWSLASEGLPGASAYPTSPPLLAIRPDDPDVVYALIRRRLDSARGENALYKTVTGGRFWRELTGLAAPVRFSSLTCDPHEPRRLLLAHEGGVVAFYDDPSWDVFFREPASPVRALTVGERARAAVLARGISQVGEITVMEADRELFHEFDLHGRSLQFVPVFDSRQRFLGYDVSFIPFVFLPEGDPIFLRGDGSVEYEMPFSFPFYGSPYARVFINADGNLTFGSRDPDPTPSELEFVTKQPRIAPLWLDLDPSLSSPIRVGRGTDRVVVTWRDVPEVPEVEIEGAAPRNTFQVVLFRDGRIVFSYGNVQSVRGLVGISPGARQVFWRVKFTQEISNDPQQPTSFRPPLRQGDLPIGELFRPGLLFSEVARRFYAIHSDEFDLLIVYGASTFEKLTITGRVVRPGAFTFPVAARAKNEIEGIGLPLFNDTAMFGSAGRLRLVVNMDLLRSYPADPLEKFQGTKSAMDILAQMVGHAWGAYVRFDDEGVPSDALLSGMERFTWSFFLDTDASELDGHKWEALSLGFRSVEVNERYSPLDQYLMGLRAPDEVPPFFLIIPRVTGGRTRGSPPELGAFVSGTRRWITLQEIMRVEGARRPSYPDAPRVFRLAFILVAPEGAPVTALDLNKINLFRLTFEDFFVRATGGRGRVETRLVGQVGS